MSLPEQIQRQVDEAKGIIKQFYGTEGDNAPEGTDGTDSAPETPVAVTPVENEQVAEPAAPVGEATDTPVLSSPSQEVTHRDPEENNETYAQRWRSLQGIHSATQRKLEEATQRANSLEQLLSQMQNAKLDQSIPQPARHVTEKDVSEYGGDMVEFARRVSREEIAPLAQAVRTLLAKVDQLQGVVPTVQTVAAVQAQTAQERFYDALTARVADWRAVNGNPKFHDWLLDMDPLSGLQRQTLLMDAHNSLDVERVVNIFEMGKQALGITAAPAASATPAPVAPKSNVSKLERMVAPGRANAATTPPQQAEKKQWTRAEIAKFYTDKSRGVYKGREAEAQALERDIFAAQREGRVAMAA